MEKKYNNNLPNKFRSTASRISGWLSTCGRGLSTEVSTTLVSDLDYQKCDKDKKEKIRFETESSMQVDLCFVLDCTGSMGSYIAAAKDCVLRVVEYLKRTNPDIRLWIGFCGYRDFCDGNDRLQIFDFTDSYLNFESYLSDNVKATGGGDEPEDVLGGLDAAVNKLKWSHKTRILLHLGDSPPHGKDYGGAGDSYPNGDPNGLTADKVLKSIKSAEIHYYFGKITSRTDKMLQIFRDVIGEFLVFNIHTDGKNPEALTMKLFEAVCSSITTSVTLTTTMNKYRQRRTLEKDSREPDWNDLPAKVGELMHYRPPRALIDIKDSEYFRKRNILTQKFSYKQAPKPFSSGAERYAYFALDVTNDSIKKIVIKECINLGKQLERCLETVEISTIAFVLSTEFNSVAARAGIFKRVNFLKVQVLRHNTGLSSRYYTIEPKFYEEFKHFNVNSGAIKEYHPILEAFAHFTYENTGAYLVVYDLQGVELSDQFLLTDPAIQCADRSRFGRTNLGKRGIDEFLANHKCESVCQKLGLSKIVLPKKEN